MAPQSHPPAWYPDPRDPRRVRRWDGRAWTHEVRPLPDWLRTLRLAPGPGGGGRHARRSGRWLWLASAGLLLMGAGLMVALTPSTPEVATIDDAAFAEAAETACRRALDDALGLDPDDPAPTPAARVAARTEGWEALVTGLRELEVARADRPAVLDWLAAWEVWTDLRHAYARALAGGDEEGAAALLRQLEEARRPITRFAMANGTPSCAVSPSTG
ncbi:MAG TPA: DUF2510 domain-containing protein [Acidimicrobiales bacterium]|nr:DUF2510 domain-containing protein [Acidimicrobiales bacterium]